jgi:hypothetical protein
MRIWKRDKKEDFNNGKQPPWIFATLYACHFFRPELVSEQEQYRIAHWKVVSPIIGKTRAEFFNGKCTKREKKARDERN